MNRANTVVPFCGDDSFGSKCYFGLKYSDKGSYFSASGGASFFKQGRGDGGIECSISTVYNHQVNVSAGNLPDPSDLYRVL